MSESTRARLERVRGYLESEEPGARGLERVARNPGCSLLRALTIAGIKPATALERVFGKIPEEGQSPFALAMGIRFEQYLYQNGAERLLELYRRAHRLSSSETKVVIIPDHAPNPTDREKDPARRRELTRRVLVTLTRRLLVMKLRGDPRAPNIIVQARLPVRLLGEDHFIEPDVLVAADEDPFYRPAEVKSYFDLRGKTDPSDMRGGLRQAAVAVVALRQFLGQLGLTDPERLAPDICDLILRVPGSFSATLNSNSVPYEVASIERVINEVPRDLEELEELLRSIAQDASLDNPDVLDAVPFNYLPGCREHCALNQHCKTRASAGGNLMLLGNRAREAFAAAGTLGRTIELLDGATPRTPEEAELQKKLQEADDVLQREVG